MSSTGINQKGDISIESILQQLRSNKRFEEVGAVACFLGFVRKRTLDGKEVRHLELEAYGEGAEQAFRVIAQDIRSRPGVVDVAIHHVVGKLDVSDLILVVMVAGKSRKDAYPALVEAVERVKQEAAIWKREVLVSGESYWVGEKEFNSK